MPLTTALIVQIAQLGERKTENLEVTSSNLVLDIFQVQFSILHKYLSQQVMTPSVKNKCRVYLAKDLRAHDKQYYEVVNQLIGAQWTTITQNVHTDNFLIKRVFKLILIGLLFLIVLYIFL